MTDYSIVENVYGKYCVPNSSSMSPPAKKALMGEVYEPDTIKYIKEQAGTGDIIHAGAYFGDFLPALSKACAPDAYVWAFEPKQEHYECAKKTLELNNIDNVKMMQVAVGEAAGVKPLQVIHESGRTWGGGSRIVSAPSRKTEMVSIAAIDDVIPTDRHISVIHLDVEGFEHRALIGALGTIDRCRPTLIVERVEDIDTQWLTENILSLGYRINPHRLYLNTILEI